MDEEMLEIQGHRLGVEDYIKVLASPGKPSFIGKVKGWWIDGNTIVAVDVWGGKAGHEMMRSVRPCNVVALSTRMQNKLKAAAEARRNGDDITTKKTIGSITLRKGS